MEDLVPDEIALSHPDRNNTTERTGENAARKVTTSDKTIYTNATT